MNVFDQEILHDPAKGAHGDCMRACVYTLAGRDLGLPHPIDLRTGKDWNDAFFDEIEVSGFAFRMVKIRPGRDMSLVPRVVIAGGKSVRSAATGARHAVVWDREAARCIHDPHPDRAGILEPDWFYWIDPRKTMETTMTDEQIKHMVERFLCWKLPDDFSPDGGIDFEPEFNKEWLAKQGSAPMRHEPAGTNLLNHPQAEAMIRHLVEGLPAA